MGFELRTGLDASRPINQVDGGTKIGLALWYPARSSGAAGTAMTNLDYRLLEFVTEPSEAQRAAYLDNEVAALVSWRHVGVVAMTRAQARESLETHGLAVRGAPVADGRFPVVVVLGGQHYLSTTAEILASHGFLVVAPFRFSDQSNEIGTSGFTWYLENSVRDAEWALNEIASHPSAEPGRVSAIGHGGGGMIAMLLAMRNRTIQALVNIDSGNFSTRSGASQIAFYDPRLLRVPYLFIATAETRKTQDLFDQFTAMAFSERVEVVVEGSDIRHHDLSDLGRAVTAPMAIRGAPQADVQQRFVEVQEMAVRFLLEQSGRPADGPRFADWLKAMTAARYAVTFHSGRDPAPTVVRVLDTLDRTTPAALRDARRRDPDAPLFQPSNLGRVISKAIVARDFQTAIALADFALEVHPGTPAVLDLKSQALEGSGDLAGASSTATACAARKADNDWQAAAAIDRCKERAERLGRASHERSAR